MTYDAPDWRKVIALLANDRSREVFARVIVGDALPTGVQFEKALAGLADAQLVTFVDGKYVADGSVFRGILERAAAGVPQATGIHRFVKEGRIHDYPSGAEDRQELLQWVAGDAFTVGDSMSEKEVNEVLAR